MSWHQKQWGEALGVALLGLTGAGLAGVGPLAGMLGTAAAPGVAGAAATPAAAAGTGIGTVAGNAAAAQTPAMAGLSAATNAGAAHAGLGSTLNGLVVKPAAMGAFGALGAQAVQPKTTVPMPMQPLQQNNDPFALFPRS